MVNLNDVTSKEYNKFINEFLKKDARFNRLQVAHIIVCFASMFIIGGIMYLITLPFEAFFESHEWAFFPFLFISCITPFWLSPIFDKFELKMAKDIYEWEKDMGYFVIFNPYFFEDKVSIPINFEKNVLKNDKYFKFQLLKSSGCFFCKTLIEEDVFNKYSAMFEKALKENYEYVPLFSDTVFVFRHDEISELLSPIYEVYESRR